MKIKYSIDITKHLATKLKALSQASFEDVVTKQIGQMVQRTQRKGKGGTPVSTEATRPGGPHGELKSSVRFEKNTMGYTKEYAPHVEYGHRTKSGGFVPGQHFLNSNVDIQAPKYKKDLIDAIRKIAKG